jgi:hypothetical protein
MVSKYINTIIKYPCLRLPFVEETEPTVLKPQT